MYLLFAGAAFAQVVTDPVTATFTEQFEAARTTPIARRGPKIALHGSFGPDGSSCRAVVQVDPRGRTSAVDASDCPEPVRDAVERAVGRWRWTVPDPDHISPATLAVALAKTRS